MTVSAIHLQYYSKVDYYGDTIDDMSNSSGPQSFWRWRRPKYTNNGVPTDSTPTGSAADALAGLFGDVEVSDVRLQGSDGGTVVAVKAILASRSSMFRSKFFGNQKTNLTMPGEMEVVVLKHWDCRILHMVVEYCYTDSCSIMRVQPSEDIARMMAQLRVASKAFKLPGLLDKIKQWSWRQINRHPALACALVDEGMRLDDIDELALQTLQIKPRAAMLPDVNAVGSGVLALTKPGLLFVLRTLEDTTSHLLLLQVIERWVDFSDEDSPTNGRPSSPNSPQRERSAREAFGRKCVLRFVKTSQINPDTLERAVQRSTLFQTRNDLTSVSLLEGMIQFSEKSYNVDGGSKGATPSRRPQTAIGIVTPSRSSESGQPLTPGRMSQ